MQTVKSLETPALRKGDTVGVFAPSSLVETEDIEKSIQSLSKYGLKVFVHPQTYERENQSAGNHLQKSLAFQGLWQRKDIKAIWAAGGGNRCMHILDTINFKKLPQSPKTLIGFSDVTALINAVYAHTGIVTIHGPVFKNLHKHKELDHLIDLLLGKPTQYPVKKNNVLRHGYGKGRLIGGNLSLFQYLPQTLPNKFYHDSILFLEDIGEELSRLDRMLLHLKRLGVLNKLKAIVFGEFLKLKDTGTPFGYKFKEIVEEHVQDLDIPILINMPFGHGENLYAFPVGCEAELDTSKLNFKLSQSALSDKL